VDRRAELTVPLFLRQMGSAKRAFAEAEMAFKAAGTPERLRIMVAEGAGHNVTAEERKAALERFVKYLK
jgi:hypothetical protein